MSSSNLKRWSGVAALLGGGLLVAFDGAESIVLGNQPFSEAAATGAWIVVQGGYMVAAVLVNLGLLGLYLRQARKAGAPGLIAFLAAFIGGMMATGATWSEAFFGTWLAEAAPELLDAEPAGIVVAGALLSYLLFALGWFLFGLVSLRTGVLPRGAAILLMIGAVLFALLGAMELPLANAFLGSAVTWMGYGLLAGAADEPELMAEAPV
ncbi:MAG: hypothetical protein PVG71_06270 [Anaerolineae bacterium]